MKKIQFSSLPVWYRLTWLIGAIFLVVLIHITSGAVYFTLIDTDPQVGCERVQKIIIEKSPQEWLEGESYSIQNNPIDGLNTFYFYTPEEKLRAKSRFGYHIRRCGLSEVIGELYPNSFTYSNYVGGYHTEYVVNEDLMIYRLWFGLDK